MRTLTIAATSSGAGASTLAALAYLAVHGQPTGAPLLHAAPGSNLFQRLPVVTPRLTNSLAAIWETGVLAPTNLIGSLRTSTLLALATPATPLGHADALNYLRAVGNDPQNLQRIMIVTIAVYGSKRIPAAIFPVLHIHVPHDRALVGPGPIPNDQRTYSRATRAAMDRLATVTTNTLRAI